MTRLAIMSDLHIDLNQFTDFETNTLMTLLKELQIEHLHLAGDLANHFQSLALPFLKQLNQVVTTSYHFGNHDMLGLSEEKIKEQDFKTYFFDKRQLLAFHGWYDYSFSPNKSPIDNLALKKQFWFDRRLKRPLSDPEICQESLNHLHEKLRQAPAIDLVTMHFVPHRDFCLTHPKFSHFNAFLGSQSYHHLFVEHGIKDVVFGHGHRSYPAKTIDGVTYHTKPLGYRREWSLTQRFLTKHPEYYNDIPWKLNKHYQAIKKLPAFQDTVKKEFKEELKASMTIFDC